MLHNRPAVVQVIQDHGALAPRVTSLNAAVLHSKQDDDYIGSSVRLRISGLQKVSGLHLQFCVRRLQCFYAILWPCERGGAADLT